MLRWSRVFLVVLASCGACHAQDAASVLARAKAASGGERWDAAKSWHGDGTFSSGGLSGDYHATVDLLGGRSVDSYRLGSVEGAEGYDGKLGWERDPDGAVAALDAPEAVRRARTQAWLDARAYWYPRRGAAGLRGAQRREVDGRVYDVVDATPAAGDPVALWFAADGGQLARVVQRAGQDTVTTLLDDYRDAGGLRLPFRLVTDKTDAAGRTDPRRRTEIHYARIVLDVAVADADFAMPEMAASAFIDDASGRARIPFELVNNHIFVDASVNGRPARLIVDTAGANMLTPQAAARFGIVGEGKLSAAGSGEERTDFAVAHLDEFHVGAARLEKPVFYIVDLGRLADVEGVPLDGLVGYELFRRFGTTIDYARREFVLTAADRFTPPAGASAIAFDMDDRVPIVDVTLGGLPARVTIDTGSRSSLTLHSPYVRAHDLVARYRAAPESVTGWGIGGAVRGRVARLPALVIGDQRIDGIAGELFTGDKGSFASADLSGNLGSGVLRRFTVAFDYVGKKMYLVPNALFGKADPFDRSGLWLLRDGDKLQVTDVVVGTAADHAGLRVDDRIVAFDDEPVTKRSLAEWRARLREAPVGTVVHLRFQRAGEVKSTTLTLAERLPAIAAK